MLSSEAERLVTESKVSAGKVTNYHMELVQKQRSEMELSDKIRRLEGEIQQVNYLHVKDFLGKMGILCFSYLAIIDAERFHLHLSTHANILKYLHKKRISQDCFATPPWSPFHWFREPIWPP